MNRALLSAAAIAVATGSVLACDKEDAWKLKAGLSPVYGEARFEADFLRMAQETEPGSWHRDDFPRVNLDLLAHLPLNWFPGANTSGADCWGYTSPSGREYALIGLRNGTAIVEVTDPVNPVLTKWVPSGGSLWHDVTVVGDYAYAATDVEVGIGIQVIDLRTIDSGTVPIIGERRPGGINTIHTLLSNEASGRLFACGSNISNGGCVVLNVATDPQNPTITGAWTTQYVHECQAVTHTSGPYAGQEIVYLFAAGPYYGYGTGFATARINGDGTVTPLDLIGYSEMSFCHQGALTEDYQYLYVNDELDEYTLGVTPNTHIFNVSNVTDPTWVGKFTRDHFSIDHNEYVKGDYLYQSNYLEGFHLYDISNRVAPVKVSSIDTYPEGNGISFAGNWGNYPYFESDIIILSDINRGMFIVRVPAPPCVADFDGNGVLNVFDFLAFQTAFSNSDPAADMDGNGAWNVFDFLAFQTAFSEGC